MRLSRGWRCSAQQHRHVYMCVYTYMHILCFAFLAIPIHLYFSQLLQNLPGFGTELPWCLRRQSTCLQCGKPRFDPWVGKMPWKRKWQPTPVFLPGESHGCRSLEGYSPRGRKELDPTERLHFTSFTPVWVRFNYLYLDSPYGSAVKNLSTSLISGLGTWPGEGNGNPLQCSCLENCKDGRLPCMGWQRGGHDSATRQQNFICSCLFSSSLKEKLK